MKTLILPGLIDAHVHLRDPGQTHKEDFHSGTAAALAGGFTTVLDMPNNAIPITTAERLEAKIKEAKEKALCDAGFYFGSLGDNLAEFEKVKDRVYGLKLYLNITTGKFLLSPEKLEAIYRAWGREKPILVHAEGDVLPFVIEIVKKTGTPTHICHVSSQSELGMIIKAKESGLPVTCGVTPHHLFLTERDVGRLGAFALMKPSLKSKKDQEFLWENLKHIDIVESDHAPHTVEEKKSNDPPFGVPGLETTLPLLLTAHSEGRISIERIVELCATNPAKIFKIPTSKETKVIVDLDHEYVIENKNLKTKCGWSPFAGQKVRGKVREVFLRGRKVFST